MAGRVLTGPTFLTDRLRLRRLREADGDALFAMDSDPRVMRFVGRPEPDRDAYMAALRDRLAQQPAREPLGCWGVERRSDRAFLGWSLLSPLGGFEATPAADEIEIGYRLRADAWGQGYATEASRAVLPHAFEDLALERVVAVIHPENAASRNVLLKLGLTEQGTRFVYDDDLPYFVIDRRDWAAS